MTNGEVGDLMYEVFVMAVQLAGPLLVISMLVGILIAIFQADHYICAKAVGDWSYSCIYRRLHASVAAGFYSQDIPDDTGIERGVTI